LISDAPNIIRHCLKSRGGGQAVVLRKEPSLADFEHPLQMLEACHARIRMQCKALGSLASHVRKHGCDGRAQQDASNVMRYFDGAGRHHHEDEEQDLFPRMVGAAEGRNAERVALLVDQLRREHREMAEKWLHLRKSLELIANDGNVVLDATEVGHFCAVYRDHIAIEEKEMMPLAILLLGAQDLAAIGEAMAVRRAIRA
jgi:hemerythrin-like domain-containing protein